jgi:hypothetical protein
MNPTEARERIASLAAQVANDPARAADLAVELEQLGRTIQNSPSSTGAIEPPIKRGMCISHDKVCKKHQICNSHPKGAIE